MPENLKYLSALAIFTILVFSNSLTGDFVYDDINLVRDNGDLRHLSSIPKTFVEFFHPKKISHFEKKVDLGYRPIRNITYCTDYFLTRLFFPSSIHGELSPVFFHLTNLLIHLLNVFLVFLILQKITGSSQGAFMGALLFALHPIQTESVTYISGRRDVLAGFFSLSTFWLYLKEEKSFSTWGAMIFLFLLGLLSKEVVIVLPLALLWFSLSQRKNFKREYLFWAVLFLITGAFLAFKLFFKNPTAVGLARVTYWGGSPLNTLFTMPRVFWKYAALLIFPLNLSVDYSHRAFSPSAFLRPWTALPAFLALGALIVLLWVYRKKSPAFGGWWFLIFLLPMSQIIPHPERMAERFLYLPLFGLSLPLAWLLKKESSRSALTLFLILFLTLLAFRTHLRNRDWQNSYTLWRSAVSTYPDCARARMAYGKALLDQGDQKALEAKSREALALWEKATKELERALELTRDREGRERAVFLNSLFLKGLSHLKMAQWQKAREALRELIEMKNARGIPIGKSPEHTHVHINLAAAYQGLNQPEESKKLYQKVLALSSKNPTALLELGKIYLQEGREDRAQEFFSQALLQRSSPNLETKIRLSLAVLRLNHHRFQEARALLHPLLEGSPDSLTLYLYGKICVALGNPTQGLHYLEKASQKKDLSPSLALSISEEFLTLKKSLRAAEILEGALRRDPSQGAILERLLEIKLALKRDEEAWEILQKHFISTPRMHLLRGKLLEQRGHFKEALLNYQKTWEGSFFLPGVKKSLDLSFERGLEKEVISELFKLYPQKKELFLTLGDLYLKSLDFQNFSRTYQKALSIFSGDGEIEKRILAGRKFQEQIYSRKIAEIQKAWKKENWPLALKLACQAAEIDPHRGEPFTWKGKILYRQGHFKEASFNLRQGLSKGEYGTFGARIWYLIGQCEYRQRKFPQAYRASQQALAIYPEYPPGLKLAGLALWEMEKKKEAQVFFRKYLKTPQTPEEKKKILLLLKKSKKSKNKK